MGRLVINNDDNDNKNYYEVLEITPEIEQQEMHSAYMQAKNAYSIDFVTDPADPTKTIAEKTYLFTYVPSISYNFKF